MKSDDGLCYGQIVLAEGVAIGHASMTQIARGAYQVLSKCVRERRVGGIASNIGQSQYLF